jgi:hypothetical protein
MPAAVQRDEIVAAATRYLDARPVDPAGVWPAQDVREETRSG